MKQHFTILIGFLLLFFSAKAQVDTDNLSISGQVRVLVGLEINIPIMVTIEITQLHRVEISDSIGNFSFENLKPSKYNIKVYGYGYQPADTLIELSNKSEMDLHLLVIANCDVNKEIADQDIKRNKPRLLLVGSIAPIIYPDQDKFEKKYNIKYFDYGCVTPAFECIDQYNKRIFEYLDLKYGKEWRKHVREDVIGFNKLK